MKKILIISVTAFFLTLLKFVLLRVPFTFGNLLELMFNFILFVLVAYSIYDVWNKTFRLKKMNALAIYFVGIVISSILFFTEQEKTESIYAFLFEFLYFTTFFYLVIKIYLWLKLLLNKSKAEIVNEKQRT